MNRRTVAGLAIEPTLTVGLAATNAAHGLMWRRVAVVSTGPGPAEVAVSFGPYFYVHSAWAYGVILAGVVLFTRRVAHSGDLYRAQTLALIVGASLPLVVSVGNTAGVLQPPIPAPVAFAVAAVALGHAVFRHRLLDVVPVARDPVIENMRDGVVVLDGEQRVVDANPAARRIADADPVGRHFAEAFPRCADLATDGAATEELDVDSGGETRHFRVELEPLDDDGSLGSLVSFRDVTEQRRRERELERTNERLDEFASVVAHDLRNPLSVAAGYLDVAREDGGAESLAKIGAAHDRMESILENLLTLARQGQPVDRTERLDLAGVAADAWALVETGDLSLDVDATGGAVVANRERLQQLLENLFRNATEHATGATVVRVGEVERDGRPVGFFVADDGTGIPPDDRADVFESGVSSAADGTGLGLSIVRTVAESHGWEPAIRESEDGGARFEFVWQEESADPDADAAPPASD